jgi:hypothetical protein
MGVSRMAEDYREAGLDARFVERAMQTPAYDMWMPGHEELASAKVLTAQELDVSGVPRIFREVEAMAKRLNARLPVQIDRTTRFDAVEPWGPALVHQFTVQRPSEAVDKRSARISIGQAALREVCAVEANLDAMEDGASFVFFYRDIEQRPLFQITIRSCGG